LTQNRTAATIEFAKWRQCALQSGEYDELVLLSAHPSPQPNGKSIGSAGFAQLTAECRPVHWRRLANTIEIVHNGASMRI